MIANAASAPPIAIEPVSPMNTSAGKALYQRKPIAPPISAAPMIARSSFVSKRWPGGARADPGDHVHRREGEERDDPRAGGEPVDARR